MLPPNTDQTRNLSLSESQQQAVSSLLQRAETLSETDVPGALELVENALRLVNAGSGYEPLEEIVAQSFHLQGRLFINHSEYREGLIAFSKAQAIYEALEKPEGAAVELLFIGIAQAYVGLYADALKNMFQALAVFESGTNREQLTRTLNAIGYSYVLMNEFEKALPFLVRSTEVARSRNDKLDLANALDSLGAAYLGLGDLDGALGSSSESVQLCKENGALIKQAEYMLGLGSIHAARNDVLKAESCFNDSLSLSRKYGYRFIEAVALQRLGKLAYSKQDVPQAISLLESSLEISNEIGANQKSYKCLSDLADVCKAAGDFKSALHYFEKYHTAREALFTEQAEFRVKSLEVAYKLKEANKEKEIFYLKNVALQREIEERMKAQALAEHLAITDSLTGLFNRRQLLDLAEREVLHATRYNRQLTLIVFDLDHFKKINDTFGHATGDKVLIEVTRFVQGSVRKCDIIGRFGGEEFALLLPETPGKKALAMFERIRVGVAKLEIQLEETTTAVTISAGIAEVQPQDSLADLLDRADKALYVAKSKGRNRTMMAGE